MTSLLENLVGVIAPHYCFVCSKENNMLCEQCAMQFAGAEASICFLCEKPTADFALCRSCAAATTLQHVWPATTYDGVVAQVIKQYKFGRAQAASLALARLVQYTLPLLPMDTLIVPVPTAPAHVRQRGYDHTLLLAKALSRATGLGYRTLLRRTSNVRQLGATRAQRLRQLQGDFVLTDAAACRNATILLLDDVSTTGATLLAAASVLQTGGVGSIQAAVVARHTARK